MKRIFSFIKSVELRDVFLLNKLRSHYKDNSRLFGNQNNYNLATEAECAVLPFSRFVYLEINFLETLWHFRLSFSHYFLFITRTCFGDQP